MISQTVVYSSVERFEVESGLRRSQREAVAPRESSVAPHAGQLRELSRKDMGSKEKEGEGEAIIGQMGCYRGPERSRSKVEQTKNQASDEAWQEIDGGEVERCKHR